MRTRRRFTAEFTDCVFIERLWRSLECERLFLNAFETGSEVRGGIGSWIDHCNRRRPRSSFGGRTPDEVYAMAEMTEKLAARTRTRSTVAKRHYTRSA